MKKGPITPKGFRDINPDLAKKRRDVINTISDVLESSGFVPIETPSIEYADTLLGKYGSEEKLIYQFKDRGGRELALRYDLTVPLARFITNNPNLLKPTFSRYQIGNVFRGEKPQRGRYREFIQFDFDTVGSSSLEDDAKVIASAIISVRKVGLPRAAMAINDRKNFEGIPSKVITIWDKYYKIGADKVQAEINDDEVFNKLKNTKETKDYAEVKRILETKYDLNEGKDFFFDKTLARGLDYYTGLVFELKPSDKPGDLSLGGGGRYDNLIGMFADKQIPAVGFSFGIDRLTEELK